MYAWILMATLLNEALWYCRINLFAINNSFVMSVSRDRSLMENVSKKNTKTRRYNVQSQIIHNKL